MQWLLEKETAALKEMDEIILSEIIYSVRMAGKLMIMKLLTQSDSGDEITYNLPPNPQQAAMYLIDQLLSSPLLQ